LLALVPADQAERLYRPRLPRTGPPVQAKAAPMVWSGLEPLDGLEAHLQDPGGLRADKRHRILQPLPFSTPGNTLDVGDDAAPALDRVPGGHTAVCVVSLPPDRVDVRVGPGHEIFRHEWLAVGLGDGVHSSTSALSAFFTSPTGFHCWMRRWNM